MLPTYREAQDPTGAPSLPRGLGARRARGWRWRRGGSGGVRTTARPAGGEGAGARWRSAVWGGVTGAARGAEQVRRDVRYLGATQRGSASDRGSYWPRPGDYAARMGKSPGELELLPRGSRGPGTALGGQRAPGTSPASGVAASCLCWTEVWSPRSQPVSGKPASGIPGEPGILLRPWRHLEAWMGQQARLGGMPNNAARLFAVQ